MRRREFLVGAVSAGLLAGQERGQRHESLAYLADDGLWMRDLPDGRPQRVAASARLAPKRSSPGLEWTGMASPRMAPSGEWISYQEHGQAWVVARDARARSVPKALANGATQWCSRRDELLLEKPHGLSVFSASNGWAGPVRTIPDAALPVVFSADGGEMVYGRAIEAGSTPGSGATGFLCRVDTDAALPPKTILERRSDGLIPYAWIGDAVWYWVDPSFSGSFQADGLELFRVPAAGGDARSLGVTTLVHEDFLAVSPDANQLAVTDGGGRESWSHKRIALINLTSGTKRYLTDEQTAAICPAWSPDGRKVAYVALPEGLDRSDSSGPERLFLRKRRIWVTGAAAESQPVELTPDDRYRDENPFWLADGRHILFCRIERGPGDRGTKTIWRMDDDGKGLTQVAGPLQNNDSFDGEYWFGYYGTIDWRAVMDYHKGGN